MTISTWPPGERPRERLLRDGCGALSDAELLAIFIHTGYAGTSAVDIARQALSEFGGLSALLQARRADVARIKGLGPARYALLQAALELGRRHLEGRLRGTDALRSPNETRSFLQAHLRGLEQEVFAGLFLDNRHRVIEFEQLFKGTIDGASVYPREVVKRALAHNAAALIVAHNHPSGVAEPSAADRAITERLRSALALVDVRLLDHVVVGQGEFVSLAERGWL